MSTYSANLIKTKKNIDNRISQSTTEVATEVEDEMNYTYNEGTVIKRADGRYEAKLYIDGKQKSISCKKKKIDVVNDLNKAIEKKNKQKQINQVHQIGKSAYTLFSWLDHFYEKYKKDKIKSHSNIERTIRLHIKPYTTDKPLKKVTLEDLENIILAEKSTRMQEDIYKLLLEALKKAKKLKYISEIIADELDDPKHIREEGTARTEEELKNFFDIVSKQKRKGKYYLNIFKLYLLTGCRADELFRIYGKHINFEQETLYIDGTKNTASKRVIPLFKGIKDILQNINIELDNPLINCNYETLKSFLRRIKQKHPHIDIKIKDFRTTFGTMLAQKGVAETVLAKWMGHTDIKTTRKYYIKILSDYEKFQMQKANTIDPNNLDFNPI